LYVIISYCLEFIFPGVTIIFVADIEIIFIQENIRIRDFIIMILVRVLESTDNFLFINSAHFTIIILRINNYNRLEPIYLSNRTRAYSTNCNSTTKRRSRGSLGKSILYEETKLKREGRGRRLKASYMLKYKAALVRI
jgi:hypothetical protein